MNKKIAAGVPGLLEVLGKPEFRHFSSKVVLAGQPFLVAWRTAPTYTWTRACVQVKNCPAAHREAVRTWARTFIFNGEVRFFPRKAE